MLHVVLDWLAYAWDGPPSLPRRLRMDWRFVAVRWLGIVLFAPALLLANLPAERLVGAYAVLLLAAAYNTTLGWLILHRPAVMAGGYVSTVCDGVLALAMVYLGGGFDSPSYVVLFMVTLAAAMQYGYRPSLGVSLFYVCADAVAHGSIQGGFVYRSLMMVLTTVLAGYLREQAQQAEAALEERLGQSTALNDATAVLGASLDLESVLRAAVAAAAQLFGSPLAVLQPSADLGGLGATLVEPITFPDHEASPTRHALEQLCAREAASAGSLSRGDALIRVEALPGGREAIVLVLALAPRQAVLGTLAVVVPAGTSVTFDSDILDAFLERLTLAIENAALYRALAERSNDLQRAYSDLASAHQELLSVDQMKTNFLANVSHELRTPLTSIRSFSELLLGDDESPTVRKEFLHIINTESERLTRLVDDVLDISRIEAGHMTWHMQSVDLGRLLRESGRAFSAAAERQHLRLELDLASDLPGLWGDRDRLYQVVANLLNNAIKFTQPGGSVGLAAEHDAAHGEVRIRVADTGVGIAPADQRRIFDKFQQVGDTLTDKPKGTGLGLAISRDIVEHHGGRVWVESYPGVGSTFTVALPLPSRVAAEQAA